MSDIDNPGNWRPPSPLVEIDPPAHTEIRLVMNKIMAPSRIQSWRDRFRETATTICESVLEKGTIDAAKDIAEKYIFQVFSESLGVDLDLRKTITLGDFIFNAGGPQNELYHRSKQEIDEISEWFDSRQKREAMIPGGLGELIYEAEDRDELPPGTAPLMVRTLLRGGMDTTISSLSTTLRLLAENPDAWQKAKAEPAFVMDVFEEAIRLESPSQIHFRTTTKDVEFAGVTIPANSKIAVGIGSANRDPRFWEAPDEFRPRTRTGRHLGFGIGPHVCLGRHMAKLEIECFLTEFLSRVNRLEIAGPYKYRVINGLRTLDTLPLTVS
ncbi:MAG: cytochrome P450 [Porticoccaceae bacterium]|nr:cytochrome P450 [Porticoccaceae bacterium]